MFLSGICTWYCSHMKFTHFSTIPKEWQEVLFLRNPLFSAADPRKPLKVNPSLLSSTTAGRILAALLLPSAAFSHKPCSSVPHTGANPLYFYLACSTKAHLKTCDFNQNLAICKDTSIHVSHTSVTNSGPAVPQQSEGCGTPTGTSSCQRWTQLVCPQITHLLLHLRL